MDGAANRVLSTLNSLNLSTRGARSESARAVPCDRTPLVSVVLPTYNGATRGFLCEAVESVLAQTYPHWELIIVDDGSTDRTPALLRRYDNPAVQVIHQHNQGLAAARNTGILHSAGDYICFLDDDDRYLPSKLAQQVRFFQAQEDRSGGRTKLIAAPITLIDTHGRRIGRQAHRACGDIYHTLFTTNLIDSPSSVMVKRDVLAEVGIFNPALRSIEDLDLWLRIAQHHEIHTTDEVLVEYRVHTDKMSTNLDTMYRYRRLVIEKAIRDNQRTDVPLNRREIFFQIEKQYFEKHIDTDDPAGAWRHLRCAWRESPWRVIGNPKMAVKMLLLRLGMGRILRRSIPPAVVIRTGQA